MDVVPFASKVIVVRLPVFNIPRVLIAVRNILISVVPGVTIVPAAKGCVALTLVISFWRAYISIGVAPILKFGRIDVVAEPVVALPQVITPAVEVALTYAKEEDDVP